MPLWAEEQGRKKSFCPDLTQVINGARGTATAAGADGNITIGHHVASKAAIRTGSGNESVASTAGRLVVVTDAAANDSVTINFNGGGATSPLLAGGATAGEPFFPLANTIIRFGVRMKIDDVTYSSFNIGLMPSNDMTPGTVSWGIYLNKGDAATKVGLTIKNAASGARTLTIQNQDDVNINLVDDTYFEAGFVVHGTTRVHAYLNGFEQTFSLVGVDELPSASTERMVPVLYLFNGTTTARTFTFERLSCTQDVV
jgi:hypothetical protein